MNPLIDDAQNRPGDDPIFAINARANAWRSQGKHAINASLGALLEDDGQLAVMPSVTAALRSVPERRAAAYAPIAGDPSFLEAVRRDVFGDSPLFRESTAVATPGGTGALLNAVMNFIEPGQSFYTTNHYWGPYRTIATHNQRGVATFPMFTSAGTFDIDAFEEGLVALVERQGRALVILNFPCHNPTGYSLDAEEWDAVAAVLSRAAKKAPVALLVDLAYAHFGRQDRHLWVRAVEPIAHEVTILAAWTASKSYAQYGARVGALAAATPDDALRTAISNAASFTCRGTWSNCNHLGLLAITDLLTDAARGRAVEADRAKLVDLLDARVEAFNTAALARGLVYPRYEGGFFVSVFTPDGNRTAEAAAAEGVFVVPMDGAVRIALCAVPEADIETLVDAVARGIEAAGGKPVGSEATR